MSSLIPPGFFFFPGDIMLLARPPDSYPQAHICPWLCFPTDCSSRYLNCHRPWMSVAFPLSSCLTMIDILVLVPGLLPHPPFLISLIILHYFSTHAAWLRAELITLIEDQHCRRGVIDPWKVLSCSPLHLQFYSYSPCSPVPHTNVFHKSH